MEFRTVAISGRIAVGSSTLAKGLSEKLGWPMRDGGQIFRQISRDMGFDLETDPQQYGDEVDRRVDQETIAILSGGQPFIVTSKLACFLARSLEGVLRVQLTCSLETRIQRFSESRGCTLKEAEVRIVQREREDEEKWRRLYGAVDFLSSAYAHLVIDSGEHSVEEEMGIVLNELNKRISE